MHQSTRIIACCLTTLLALTLTAHVHADDRKSDDKKGDSADGIVQPPRVSVIVEADLMAKAPTPSLKTIHPYGEALAVYKYRVRRVRRGKLEEKIIAVTHWVIHRKVTQKIASTKVGKTVKLELCDFKDMKPLVQTVYRSDLDSTEDLALPIFHDLGQKVRGPAGERSNANYGVDLSRYMPLMFRLKDQLKLVALGDCQAWFTNKAELYMEDENRKTPVAIAMCQQRSGLPFQKLMVDQYLTKLPELEWVILTWNPRFVSSGWGEHGVKARQFANSSGFKHDKALGDDVFKNVGAGKDKTLTTAQLLADPDILWRWNQRPWGWIKGVRYKSSAKPEVLGNQKKLGRYRFVPERWAIFEDIAKTLADRKIKLLVFTTPIHPETANQKVKDKTGVDAEGYQDQVRRMKLMEKKYPGLFFFYDFNNMGDNGLTDRDFVNIDHVTAEGAHKVATKVEAFRKQAEKQARNR